MSVSPSREHIDDALNQSKPPTSTITPEITAEIQRVRAAARAATQPVRPRRWTRPVVATVTSLVLVSGAAAAAAASSGLWQNPWAEDPDGSLTFTLPSGAVCEQRFGNVGGGDSDEVAAIEAFYRETDLDALITPSAVDTVIAERRAQGAGVHVNGDGTTTPSGYGTDNYSADEEYWTAVWDIVITKLDEELARRGIDSAGTNLTFSGEANCPGAQW